MGSSHPKVPEAPLEPAAEDSLQKFAQANLPELHGQTEKEEMCKCMPGTLEPPDMSFFARQSAPAQVKADRQARLHKEFKQKLDLLKSEMGPKVKRLEIATLEHDGIRHKLHQQVQATEEAGKHFKDALQAVKKAYLDGGCDSLITKRTEEQEKIKLAGGVGMEEEKAALAELEGKAPLTCVDDAGTAVGHFEIRSDNAKATCEAGVSVMEPLRAHGLPLPALVASVLRPGDNLHCHGRQVRGTVVTPGRQFRHFRRIGLRSGCAIPRDRGTRARSGQRTGAFL